MIRDSPTSFNLKYLQPNLLSRTKIAIMKLFIVFFAAIVLTVSAQNAEQRRIRAKELAAVRRLPAVEYEEVHDKYGQYALRYVTAEGTVVSERGRLVPNIEGDGYVLIIEGEVSYISDDGEVYATKFSAGLDGTHMEGNHLPAAPEAIQPETED
ncbi:unnamed protein product [Danaus chrysippus]|uniref:(African queen) hypothetical protein n=1 Tax=Danaus chrysippus TaxID=151541 RepID=A0A8J2QDI9_9NEOP|nr:unnamed protein product [Danaus chrysippus]